MIDTTADHQDFLNANCLDHQGGLRRVALLLHSLDTLDREWLLHKLDHRLRPELHNLLQDLEKLGIPPLPEILRLALQQDDKLMEQVVTPSPAVQADSRREVTPMVRLSILSHEEVRCLATLLKREPPHLIAQLLSIKSWPWLHSVMNALDVSTRAAVQECLKRQLRQANHASQNLTAWQQLLAAAVVAELQLVLNLRREPDQGPAQSRT